MIANPRTQFIRRTFRAVAFHTLLFASMFATAAAQATDLPVQGGPGGTNFRRECSGDHVVGVYVRSGLWVDAIGLKCATFDQAQGKFKYPPWNTPYYGGGAAPIQEHVCPNDRYVSGVMFNITREGDHPFIDFVELTCSPIAGSGVATKECLQTGEGCYGQGSFVQTCPAGEAAIGIQGRSGIYVDALGLICGPKPAINTQTTTSSQSTNQPPADWADMLKAHNERRRLHCTPPLVWDARLAAEAQQWANQCTNTHSQTPGEGENLAMATSNANGEPQFPAMSDRDAFENIWYCEIQWYDFDNPQLVGGQKMGCNPPVNGHFTQVVWKGTQRLGCGRARCGQSTYWVCRYVPQGNNPDPTALAQNVLRPTCK
jgi:uncharacterized protein YkwD